jgi:hypothetical protein
MHQPVRPRRILQVTMRQIYAQHRIASANIIHQPLRHQLPNVLLGFFRRPPLYTVSGSHSATRVARSQTQRQTLAPKQTHQWPRPQLSHSSNTPPAPHDPPQARDSDSGSTPRPSSPEFFLAKQIPILRLPVDLQRDHIRNLQQFAEPQPHTPASRNCETATALIFSSNRTFKPPPECVDEPRIISEEHR